jgi:hypothetical protein
MKRRALPFAISAWFAATGLHGQGIRTPRPLPPDLPASTISVNGSDGTTATLTAADLFNLPQHTVKTTDHGNPVTFEGVLLNDVLAKVDLPTGEKFRSTAASYYLTAEGNDGYKAVFSWAEIDPTFTDRKIYLVTKSNGTFLSEKDGPFELIVPGEKRNSRWVRQVKTLTIKQAI